MVPAYIGMTSQGGSEEQPWNEIKISIINYSQKNGNVNEAKYPEHKLDEIAEQTKVSFSERSNLHRMGSISLPPPLAFIKTFFVSFMIFGESRARPNVIIIRPKSLRLPEEILFNYVLGRW